MPFFKVLICCANMLGHVPATLRRPGR